MTVPRCVVSGDRGSLIGVSRRRGRYLACMAAKSGPVYVRPDGTATCREAWPQVADLSRRPAFPSGAVYARPDLNDIISEWREKRGAQNDDLAQALIEWSTRVLEQTAENERAGVEKYSERCERAWDSIHDVENALQAHAGESFFALATVVVIESGNGEDGRSEAAPRHPGPDPPTARRPDRRGCGSHAGRQRQGRRGLIAGSGGRARRRPTGRPFIMPPIGAPRQSLRLCACIHCIDLLTEIVHIIHVAVQFGARLSNERCRSDCFLDSEFIDYAVNDTEATRQCLEELVRRFRQHRLTMTAPQGIYSEASLGDD
jgi:hypothetical protein